MPVLGRLGIESPGSDFRFSATGVIGESTGAGALLRLLLVRSFLALKFDLFVPGENIARLMKLAKYGYRFLGV